MAEESVNSSVTQEITGPHGSNAKRNSLGKPSSPNSGQNILPLHRRSSIGSCNDVGNTRRNSMGKPSSPNCGLPHYLRASTGSCHDFCKYGKEHSFEVKARRPIPKRITPPSGRQNLVETVVPAEGKKTTVIKPPILSKTRLLESPEIIKREVSSPSQKVEVFLKHASSNDVKITQNEKKIDLSVKRAPPVKPKPVTVKASSSSDTPRGLSGKRNSDIKIGKRTGTSKAAVKKVPVPQTASLTPKPSVNRVVSLNARKYRSLKLVSPLKDQNRIRNAEPKQPNSEKVQEKTLYVVKTETENKLLESTHNGSTIQLPPSPLLSSPKSSSDQNSPSLSIHEEEDLEESEYTDSEADYSISEDDETVNMSEVETSEGNHNRLQRKAGVVLSEDKDCTSTKLKFRRGKVVDLQSENNGPRRLRFRQGRVLGGNQDSKGNAKRRSFKKRGVDGDTIGTSPGSEKVVLRHQDMEGKKDAQGLFNNVIEETASKLVESRKSKVKALVGAFETVISLQESKPSTHSVT